MKTIGLLGGMSWESTQSYYALINQGVKSALGGLHSARMLINSARAIGHRLESCSLPTHCGCKTPVPS